MSEAILVPVLEAHLPQVLERVAQHVAAGRCSQAAAERTAFQALIRSAQQARDSGPGESQILAAVGAALDAAFPPVGPSSNPPLPTL